MNILFTTTIQINYRYYMYTKRNKSYSLGEEGEGEEEEVVEDGEEEGEEEEVVVEEEEEEVEEEEEGGTGGSWASWATLWGACIL